MLIAVIYGMAVLGVIGLLIYTIAKRIDEKKQEKKNNEKYKNY